MEALARYTSGRRIPHSVLPVKRTSIVLALLAAALVPDAAVAQPISGGYPFFMPPGDSATRAFLPSFPIHEIDDADFVSAVGHRFYRNGEPIRFWGANLVADGAFPTQSQVNMIVPRMRKMGLNLVRFHHIDNPWSTYSLVKGATTRQLDATLLNWLEYLIFKLKKEGIHVNMNLHVSRTFTEADGVAGADSIADFGKGVTLFDPYLIQLQKEYAQQLLGHVNPYTGRALAQDPVLAMVETANENSLYYMWRNGSLQGYPSGGKLIARHVAMLDDLWTDWLRGRYASTEVLATAWSADAQGEGPEMIVDGGFETSVGGRWQLEQHGGAVASVSQVTTMPYEGTKAARVTVTTTGTEDWRVQFKQIGLSVEQDTTYTVRFALRAEHERSIPVSIQLNVDPYTVFTNYSAAAGAAWKTFEFTFTASATVVSDLRLSFTMGAETGSVWVDAVSMRRAGRQNLDEGESLEDGTVRRLAYSEVLKYSTARLHDTTEFLIDLQNRYYDEMADFLKNDLGVQVPITGTNWNFGLVDMAVQSRMDYVDNHSYWDHPSFPNEPWSSTDWAITNLPMVRASDSGTIPRLMAGIAPADKPYTISEYNHAFPNLYQSEGVLALGAYASFQDVDGIMFFDYNGAADWTTDRISSYFSIHRNPAMMSLMPSVAYAYRNGLIREAETSLTAEYSRDDVLGYPALGGNAWEGTWMYPRRLALEHRIVTSDYDAPATNVDGFPAAPTPPFESSTGEIRWDPEGLLSVNSEAFAGVTGFLDDYVGTEIGPGWPLAVLADADGFGTITWVKLDGEPLVTPGRSLITLSSTAQNTGMGWDGTTTIHDNWGSAPTVMRPLRVVLLLQLPVPVSGNPPYLLLNALDPTGEITSTTRIDMTEMGWQVVLDQSVDQTPWFGIEYYGGTGTASGADIMPFSLDGVYPNPATSRAYVQATFPRPGQAQIEVFDLLGRRVLRGERLVDAGRSSLDVDLSHLARGMYQIRLAFEGSMRTRPVHVL